MRALVSIGKKARPAIPALIAGLSSPDKRVRQVAAEALGAFGTAAQQAVPALRTSEAAICCRG